MTLELTMTLAEALVERKGLKERLDSLEERLAVNVHVQEGDTPAETPEALLAQVDAAIADLERLIVAINRANLAARLPGEEGWSLMEAIARRDMLTLRQGILEQTINMTRMARQRGVVTRSEVRTIVTVDVAAMQKEIDALAKERRALDMRLQAANWSVQLMA
ncbi:MAG: DIP1984 family protein [Anaerolineae bacterium]